MQLPKRKPTRLHDWNYYESAWYFVTICTHHRKPLFGSIFEENDNAEMCLSGLGAECVFMLAIENMHAINVHIDSYAIMPNHIHLLVSVITPTQVCGAKRDNPLSRFVASFKGAITKIARLDDKDANVWQRGFNERVVRDERHLGAVRLYIQNNPIKWARDKYHTAD